MIRATRSGRQNGAPMDGQRRLRVSGPVYNCLASADIRIVLIGS